MKQPAYTAAPLAGEPGRQKSSFKDLFLGFRRREKYYEARDEEGTLHLLWMESPRFGVLAAYPCALTEEGRPPMVFDPSGNPAADENNALFLQRWEELSLPDRRESLIIRTLEEKEFRAAYRRCRDVRS